MTVCGLYSVMCICCRSPAVMCTVSPSPSAWEVPPPTRCEIASLSCTKIMNRTVDQSGYIGVLMWLDIGLV